MPSLHPSIVVGDCTRVLTTFPPESVGFVFTDPPYVARYRSRDGRTVANDDNASWLAPAFREVYRVLHRDAFCVSFYGWPKVDLFMRAWRSAGFRPAGHLVFVKRYDSSRRGIVAYRHENAFVLAKGNPSARTLMPDVLLWSYTGNRRHPTEKPVEPMIPVVQAFSDAGDLVLDPFCGSGSRLLAAQRMGRRAIGVEVVPHYAHIAAQRLGVQNSLGTMSPPKGRLPAGRQAH